VNYGITTATQANNRLNVDVSMYKQFIAFDAAFDGPDLI
jgi:hypothetical protein